MSGDGCKDYAIYFAKMYNYKIAPEFSPTSSDDKVSIIITHFNNEDKISLAIESCLNQTHKNIEVIVVDDNSKNTDDLKYKVSQFDPEKVKLFLSDKNNGTYSCKNYGILKSTGKYITFLDSDDVILNNHIKDLVFAKEYWNCDASISLYARYRNIGKKEPSITRISLCEPSIMINKEFAIKEIGYFNTIRFASDTEYRVRYFGMEKSRPMRVVILPKVTYLAEDGESGVSSNTDSGFGSKKRSSYIEYMNYNIKNRSYKKVEYGQVIEKISNLEDKDYGDWIYDKDVEEFKW